MTAKEYQTKKELLKKGFSKIKDFELVYILILAIYLWLRISY